jgi:hypothetical protein
VVYFSGSPPLLGIAEFIVPTGSFFHAQTHVSFHIIEELSPNVRMIPKREPYYIRFWRSSVVEVKIAEALYIAK